MTILDLNKRNQGRKGFSWGLVLLVLFDIVTVNVSYYLALMIRFYVNGQYRNIAAHLYVPAFLKFAPWYTLICILVFFLFKLYRITWKTAGLQDLNRIFIANVVTLAVQVLGTIIFVARMPITYYVIGSLNQFAMIALSRMGARLILLEKAQMNRKNVRVMIVGTGETGKIVRRQLESNFLAKPVVIMASGNCTQDKIDGIPVVREPDMIQEYIRDYKVSMVILADPLLTADMRNQLKQTAGVEVQDFSGYVDNAGADLTPKKLLEYIHGPVTVNGKCYEDGEAALENLDADMAVENIRGDIRIETRKMKTIFPDTSWTDEKDISFF